jgi:bifunctional non-homologous end joining protein LigD
MSLREYKKKRNFDITPEPRGDTVQEHNQPIFVVQRHQASHLHYDFRLEMDGVLKSWAVPKGPPATPKEKRLAVQTEDHPLEYAEFSGTIPEGQYGAGTVEIWDKGAYELVRGSFESGVLEVRLDGKKLHGIYVLVRMKDPKNWLLLKKKE